MMFEGKKVEKGVAFLRKPGYPTPAKDALAFVIVDVLPNRRIAYAVQPEYSYDGPNSVGETMEVSFGNFMNKMFWMWTKSNRELRIEEMPARNLALAEERKNRQLIRECWDEAHLLNVISKASRGTNLNDSFAEALALLSTIKATLRQQGFHAGEEEARSEMSDYYNDL